jgi:hypothetical protein
VADLLTTVSFWSLVVSVIALGVSVWAHFRATRLKAESNDLQARLVELEEEREAERRQMKQAADVTADLEKRPGRNGFRTMLVLRNQGNAPAEDVEVEFDGNRIDEHGSVHYDGATIPKIGSGAESPILVSVHSENNPPFHVRVRWSDGTGENNSFETTLTAS